MAKKKKRRKAEKIPRQRRAIETVEAILQAATYILVKYGWDGFTTNKVAEKAGVNIGSLYQYFPNKLSIVAELQRRHIDKARRNFPEAKQLLSAQPTLRQMLKMIVEAGMLEHRAAPALHRVFSEELPRSARRSTQGRNQDMQGWDEMIVRGFKELTLPHMKNVPDPELAGFVVRVAGHALLHEAANDRPELLSSPLFADEVVTLLERYLDRT